MEYAQGTLGRVFVLRLGDGDRLPDSIEKFASDQGITRAFAALLGGAGGADDGGQVVVGPEDGGARPPVPMLAGLSGVHEAAAVGTIFPDETGAPRLHMHAALGRAGHTVTGCVRPGVPIWTIAEVVIFEIDGADMVRRLDAQTGFSLLTKA